MAGGYAFQPQGIEGMRAEFVKLQNQIDALRKSLTGNGLQIDGATGNLIFNRPGHDLIIDGGSNLDVQGTGSVVVSGGGTVAVQDAAGHQAVTLGYLGGSDYGLSVTDPVSGASLPLSRLAFGLSAANAAPAVPAGAKGVWTADGLSVSVTVSTGRLLVFAGATLSMGSPTGTDLAHGYYSFAVAGPSPSSASTAQAVRTDFGSFAFQGTTAAVLTGLTAGSYTLTGAVMRTTDGTDAPPTLSASTRSLIVLPF